MVALKHSVSAAAVSAVILVGVTAAAPLLTSGPAEVDYYGRAVSWEQLAFLTHGAPTFSVTWQDADGSHSKAFNTDGEAATFSQALLARLTRDARTSSATSPPPR